MNSVQLIFCIISLFLLQNVTCLSKRCYQCRSRGELGSCRDTFPFNVTQAEEEMGIYVVPCSSGWCGKLFEGGNTYKDDDYGAATQRLCLQRGPSDDQERCTYVVWNHRKVFMCMCNGDLCNDSTRILMPSLKSLCLFVLIWQYIL